MLFSIFYFNITEDGIWLPIGKESTIDHCKASTKRTYNVLSVLKDTDMTNVKQFKPNKLTVWFCQNNKPLKQIHEIWLTSSNDNHWNTNSWLGTCTYRNDICLSYKWEV